MSNRIVEIERIYERGMREPRPGELNYELKRVLVKHCTQKPMKVAFKSVQLAVARVAHRFGITEFNVTYDRHVSTKDLPKPWVNEGINVKLFRRRPNGTLAIHRAGAGAYPHFFEGPDNQHYANLSAPRDLTIYYGIDDPHDWRHFKKIPKRLLTKWARDGRKGF